MSEEENLYIDNKYIGFKTKDTIYLQYCPNCGKENYAFAVSSGQCVWCGFDANKDEKMSPHLKASDIRSLSK